MTCSPKGLIANTPLTPEELAQQGIRWEQIDAGFQLRGPDVRQKIKNLIANLRRRVESYIEANPATDGTLDRTSAAKAAIHRSRVVECFLAAAERNGASGDLYQATYHSLLFAINYHQLTVIDNEAAIVARQKSIEGARRGGSYRSSRIRIRNRKMAQEFLNRQGERMSDTALMEKIGAAKGLKRRGSINAVNSGLRDLNHGD
jgi:hypothetical protein